MVKNTSDEGVECKKNICISGLITDDNNKLGSGFTVGGNTAFSNGEHNGNLKVVSEWHINKETSIKGNVILEKSGIVVNDYLSISGNASSNSNGYINLYKGDLTVNGNISGESFDISNNGQIFSITGSVQCKEYNGTDTRERKYI